MPEDLLETFRARADREGVPYQSQIKQLMREWLLMGRHQTADLSCRP